MALLPQMNSRIEPQFFEAYSCLELAQKLLGKILCRSLDDGNTILRGRIVETEAYLGIKDAACYTFEGRRTPANEPMYMKSGTCFVRFTYGMYYCLNLSARDEGACVLLRAIEPVENIDKMIKLRRSHTKAPSKDRFSTDPHQIANGPSKLCIAYAIDPALNKLNIFDKDSPIWLEYPDDNFEPTDVDIVHSTRVGLPTKNPWAYKLLRFYLKDNVAISKK